MPLLCFTLPIFEIIVDVFKQRSVKKFTFVLKGNKLVFDVINSAGFFKKRLVVVALSSRGVPPAPSNFNKYLRDKNKIEGKTL